MVLCHFLYLDFIIYLKINLINIHYSRFFLLLYFLFEINMIAKVHDYYLFPFFPFLFIIVSYGAFNMLSHQPAYLKYIVIFLLLILPFTTYLRIIGRWNPDSPGFNKDLLIYKDELR